MRGRCSNFCQLQIYYFAKSLFVMDEQQQQEFELFWHNRINAGGSHQQLLVDFDTFIDRFCREIQQHTAIVLTPQQRLWIKAEIDPENQNQVYKNAYLLFIKNFWSLPSNRTKLFNMKINLSKLKGQSRPLEMSGKIIISLKYPEKQEEGPSKIVQASYEVEKDKIVLLSHSSSQAQSVLVNQPKYQGFLTIGSDPEESNIIIPVDQVNPQHLKIIYSTNLQMPQGVKSTPSFQVNPTPFNRVYMRDISRSSRVRYCIDSLEKNFILKKDMVIGNIGLIEDRYEILITAVPSVTEAQVKTFLSQANSDRVSFIVGEPDKPKKIAVNFNTQSVTEANIIDMLDRQLYYPEAPQKKKGSKANQSSSNNGSSSMADFMNEKNGKNDDKLPLKMTIRNLRTLSESHYSSKSHKILRIGRNPEQCDIVINDISIRPIQLLLENANEIWFLKKLPTHQSEVYIAPEPNLKTNRNSNRIQLSYDYSQKLRISKNIQLSITVKPKNKNDQEDDFY